MFSMDKHKTELLACAAWLRHLPKAAGRLPSYVRHAPAALQVRAIGEADEGLKAGPKLHTQAAGCVTFGISCAAAV